MRSLHLATGAILCAWLMTACATEQPAPPDDPATSTDTSQVTAIPRGLSSPLLEGTIKGNEFTATTNACHVTLLFCRDPRLSPSIPSFCQNGGCSTAQAVNAAFSLCDQICGVSACNTIAQFPNSSSC